LAEKFQKRLSKPIWEAKFNDLVAKHRATGDIAGCRRLQSYRGGGLAGRIWTMIPSLPCLRLSNSHLGMALRLQTGALPAAWMYSVKGKLMCRACNKVDLKEVPSHANHCAPERRTGQNDRHDALAADFVMMAKRNRVPTMWTPNLENGKATDIGFVFPQHTIQTDVTVVSPDAPSKRGSGAPLKAANAAATVKLKEYQELVELAGDVFVPLAFEPSGAYTREVAIMLRRLRDAGTEENGAPNPMVLQEMRDRLATTMARYNTIISIACCNRQRADSEAWAKHKADRAYRWKRRSQLRRPTH
jgi:hypothetical protein